MAGQGDSKLLGVVVLARHGDRQGFYQSGTSYTPTGTTITPLGNVQEFQLGQTLRSLYLNASSPSHIEGFNSSLVRLDQIRVRADAGGEGGVILNSAMSLLQGLFPANVNYTMKLANGQTVQGPLKGYQYVPVESVEPDNDVSLEGWTKCGAFDKNTAAFYSSPEFKQKAKDNAVFLEEVKKYLDGRPVDMENMWNIFDFLNVESIHDEAFVKFLPPTFLEQARHLANYHEYGVFSSPDLSGIGNIAGRTILPSIVDSFESIAKDSDPLKLVYMATAYKPFASLFNMTGAAKFNPQLAGIVNYAGSVAYEVRNSTNGETFIRFTFKNGTDDSGYKSYNFMDGSPDVPLSKFVSTLSPAMVNTTAEWCKVCQNTKDRGCAELALAASEVRIAMHQTISPVGAGFLGAGLTLAVTLAMFGVLAFLGVLTVGRGRKKRNETKEVGDVKA